MKLYDEIKWSGFDWYVIGIQENSYKLLMKNSLKGANFLNEDNEMKFGESNIWRDSLIRDKLNNEFINNLVKEDMLEMTTRIRDDEEIIETTDYIRLLTINEILDDLPMKIRKCDNWYWSLSPRAYSYNSDFVFIVHTPGYVYNDNALNAGSVRPVVLIDKSALEKCNQNDKLERFSPCLGGIMSFESVEHILDGYAEEINKIIDYIKRNNL